MANPQDDSLSWHSGYVSSFTNATQGPSSALPQGGGMLNRFIYDTTHVQDRLIQGHPPTEAECEAAMAQAMEAELARLLGAGANSPQHG